MRILLFFMIILFPFSYLNATIYTDIQNCNEKFKKFKPHKTTSKLAELEGMLSFKKTRKNALNNKTKQKQKELSVLKHTLSISKKISKNIETSSQVKKKIKTNQAKIKQLKKNIKREKLRKTKKNKLTIINLEKKYQKSNTEIKILNKKIKKIKR